MANKGGLGEVVYEKLKQDILSGKFSPKDKLNENAIAELYKVSRTPVREALQKLAKEGLVVKKEDGYYVAYLTKEEILKVFEARIALETYIASKVSSIKNLEKIKKLSEIINDLEKIKENNDKIKEIEELINRFHLELAKASDNEFLYEFVEQLLSRLIVTKISSVIVTEMKLSIIERLKKILEELEANNPEMARNEMKNYLEALVDYIKKTVIII
ncbi:MAG: GntR family transcriptional regulator [Sulfolobaceae archaeon]